MLRFKLLAISLAFGAAGALGYTFLSRPSPPAPPDIPSTANAVRGHIPFGPVNPRKPSPLIALTMDDNTPSDFATATRGRWRLVQIIFTNCTTTCPLQGAIFQRSQQLLKEAGLDVGLLSISIDPDHDDAPALKNWLATFDAGPSWRAAVAARKDVGALLEFVSSRKSGLDVHDARVYFLDPEGRLAYASEDLPDPTAILALIREALDS